MQLSRIATREKLPGVGGQCSSPKLSSSITWWQQKLLDTTSSTHSSVSGGGTLANDRSPCGRPLFHPASGSPYRERLPATWLGRGQVTWTCDAAVGGEIKWTWEAYISALSSFFCMRFINRPGRNQPYMAYHKVSLLFIKLKQMPSIDI